MNDNILGPEQNRGTILADDAPVDLAAEFEKSNVKEVLDKLNQELTGLKPVKTRICEIAAQLLVDRLGKPFALTSETPTIHITVTGNPRTGENRCCLTHGRNITSPWLCT